MVSDEKKQHIERINNLIRGFDDPCDGTIYHYTSSQGLQGIIGSHELWLTNTEFVNDITECRALYEEAKRGLLSDEDLSNNPYVKKSWEYFQNTRSKDSNYYVASFSKNKNSLEQWRAYGRFCIGLDAQKLKTKSMKLYECVYDSKEIKEWILKKANEEGWKLDEPDRTQNYISNDGVPTTLHDDRRDAAAFDLIYKASIKYKNENYQNEEEIRSVTVSNHDWGIYEKSGPSLFENDRPIHFRIHPEYNFPIPYVKFFIPVEADEENSFEGFKERQIKEQKLQKENRQKRDLLPIKEVWIGPGPHKDETRLACEILLQEKGYKDVQI